MEVESEPHGLAAFMRALGGGNKGATRDRSNEQIQQLANRPGIGRGSSALIDSDIQRIPLHRQQYLQKAPHV